MTHETRAGIVAVLFVAALVGSLIFLRGGVDFRDRGYEIHVVASNAGGIITGASVQMAGVDIGRVIRADLTDDRMARITLRIRQGIEIPTGSRFSVGSTGLLGDRFMAIAPEPGNPPPLAPGTVVTAAPPISVEDIMERVVTVARHAEETLVSINRLIGDPELGAALDETVRTARDATVVVRQAAENVERTTRAIDRIVGTAGEELPAIAGELRQMATDLAAMAGDMAATAADLRAVVRDLAAGGETSRQIRQTVTSIQRAADGIEKMMRDLRGLINEDEVQAVKASLDEARQAVTEARQTLGEGRALIGRADQAVTRIQQVLPERLELPDVRTAARLEYGLWYDGQRLGNDVILTLQPDAPTNYILSLREYGGSTRVGLQVSNILADRLRIRYGLIESNLGVGLDYRAGPRLSYTMDLHNINQLTLNLYLRYALNPNYGLTLRAQDVLQRPVVGLGAYYRF
jgi:phospholipid/cholesterol/gamma-HCH transport system substrate-binding protein